MNKFAALFVAIVFCAVASASPLTEKIRNASSSEVQSLAKYVAEQVAKDTPTRIDGATTLTAVIFTSSTNTFIYRYEFNARLNPGYIRTRLIAGICSNEILRAFLDKAITFQYYYYAPDGSHLHTENVVAQNCESR